MSEGARSALCQPGRVCTPGLAAAGEDGAAWCGRGHVSLPCCEEIASAFVLQGSETAWIASGPFQAFLSRLFGHGIGR